MKKVLFIFFGLIILLSLLGLNNSVNAQQKEKIIKGEVVDILTYVSTGKSGNLLKDAMLESSKKGNPLGILASGKVYLVISQDQKGIANDLLTPFLCDKVVAKGIVLSKGGVNVIILSNIDKDMKAK
jgi:hypothetical protein